MQDNSKRLLLVLGMHRSGTSLISRSLKIFDASHGDKLLPYTYGNDKGHWEDQDFFLISQEMLKVVGKSWSSVLPITKDDVEILCQHGYLKKAQELLSSRFNHTNLFALKEPRITKLLPFWIKIFETNSIKVNYIFAIRHPLSVANSLYKRREIPIEHGLLLWYSYNAYALAELLNKRVLMIDYDDFLANTTNCLEKMSTALNLEQNQLEREIFLEGFLDKNMRNFNHTNGTLQTQQEKHYIKLYKYLLKNMYQNYISKEFIQEFTQGIIYATLEKLIISNSKV